MPDVVQFLQGQILQMPAVPQGTLHGQTIIVTGANTGLGFDSCKHFLRLGASQLIMGCRNAEAAAAAREKLLAYADGLRPQPKQRPVITVWPLDLASHASVVAFGRRCGALERLDALVANAGVEMKDWTMTEDCETTMTVNVVSTFLLAFLVLPKLTASARATRSQGHLVLLGSMIHIFAETRHLQGVDPKQIFAVLSDEEKSPPPHGQYFLSKLLVLLGARELASRVKGLGGQELPVVVNCVNPGWCKTELFRNDAGNIGQRTALRVIGRTSEEGSRSLVHAVLAGPKTHGQYLSEDKVKQVSTFVQSPEGSKLQSAFWQALCSKMEQIEPGVIDPKSLMV